MNKHMICLALSATLLTPMAFAALQNPALVDNSARRTASIDTSLYYTLGELVDAMDADTFVVDGYAIFGEDATANTLATNADVALLADLFYAQDGFVYTADSLAMLQQMGVLPSYDDGLTHPSTYVLKEDLNLCALPQTPDSVSLLYIDSATTQSILQAVQAVTDAEIASVTIAGRFYSDYGKQTVLGTLENDMLTLSLPVGDAISAQTAQDAIDLFYQAYTADSSAFLYVGAMQADADIDAVQAIEQVNADIILSTLNADYTILQTKHALMDTDTLSTPDGAYFEMHLYGQSTEDTTTQLTQDAITSALNTVMQTHLARTNPSDAVVVDNALFTTQLPDGVMTSETSLTAFVSPVGVVACSIAGFTTTDGAEYLYNGEHFVQSNK